jgi:ankyrin repeat protein
MRAAMFNDPEGIMILLDSGADVNAVDSEGRTALFYARGNDKLKGTPAFMFMEEKTWR